MSKDGLPDLGTEVDRLPSHCRIETYVPCQGPVATLVRDLEGGVRSGLSYCNSSSIADLHQQTIEFVKVSYSGQQENMPHAAFRSFESWDGYEARDGDETDSAEVIAAG